MQKQLPPFKRAATVKQNLYLDELLLISASRRSSACLPDHASDDLYFVKSIRTVMVCAPDGHKIMKYKDIDYKRAH